MTYTELARMIDHALLHPTLTTADLRAGCAMALHYGVATVCIKPYAIGLAAELLVGSPVGVGTVIGFPHGSHSTGVKVHETVAACEAGAVEIDMVVNIGQVLSEAWDDVKAEIAALRAATRAHGAVLKVIFENDYLTQDFHKIRLCEICSEQGADFVKTSTGFGFVKGSDGTYATVGATTADLRLMRAHSAPHVQVKASGGVRDLDGLLHVRSLGATRLGTSATRAILDEAARRYGGGPGSVTHDGGAATGY
ncbi:MAG: deoxyribose-phosphate aldolase [Bacteroidia bacterium]